MSFAELLERAGRICSLLRASGVEPGDRVVVQVEKSVSGVCLYLAVLQAGAVYVPLNPAYTPAEVEHFLGRRRAEGTWSAIRRRMARWRRWSRGGAGSSRSARRTRGRCLAQASRLPSEREVAPRQGADLAAILYTSGTTGRSKGAMLTNDNLWSNVATLHAAWGLRPDDVLIHALPLFHTHGLFVALNLMLMNGGRMIFLPRFDAEEVIGLLPRATRADGGADLLHAGSSRARG